MERNNLGGFELATFQPAIQGFIDSSNRPTVWVRLLNTFFRLVRCILKNNQQRPPQFKSIKWHFKLILSLSTDNCFDFYITDISRSNCAQVSQYLHAYILWTANNDGSKNVRFVTHQYVCLLVKRIAVRNQLNYCTFHATLSARFDTEKKRNIKYVERRQR